MPDTIPKQKSKRETVTATQPNESHQAALFKALKSSQPETDVKPKKGAIAPKGAANAPKAKSANAKANDGTMKTTAKKIELKKANNSNVNNGKTAGEKATAAKVTNTPKKRPDIVHDSKSTSDPAQKKKEKTNKANQDPFAACRSTLRALSRLPSKPTHSSLPSSHVALIDSVLARVVGDWIPTASELEIRSQLVQQLNSDLQEKFPDCKLHVFGSSVNGFGFTGSDLDVVVIQSPAARVEPGKALKELAKFLRAGHNSRYGAVTPIPSARVPIVKMTIKSKGAKIAADVSFDRMLGVRNSAMLRRYADVDDRVIYLG